MDKVDFDFDRPRFCDTLIRNSNSLEMANNHLWELIEAWPQFSKSILMGYVQVDVNRRDQIVVGSILGKPFTIKFAPVAGENFCKVEAAIFIGNPLSGTNVFVGSFRADHNGDILNAEGETILGSEADFQSCELLVAVVRKILSTPQSPCARRDLAKP